VTVGVLPSYLAQGVFFEEPSDNLFGCLDAADEYPEVAVGRLPARSAAEAQVMVDKVAARLADARSGEPAVHAALVVGDNALALFTDGANELAGLFGAWGSVEKVMFGNYGSVAAIRAAIIAGWAKRPRYFVYYGHASGSALGTGLVIRASDVPSLAAGQELPAGVVLGCLAGYFNYTNGSDSLAELMLKQPGKGVCALVAPAGMSAPEGQLILGRELAKAIADGRAQSLGQALMLAKRRVPAAHADVLRSFNLLGDPALQ